MLKCTVDSTPPFQVSAFPLQTYVLANLHCRDSEKGAISNAVALDFLLRLCESTAV